MNHPLPQSSHISIIKERKDCGTHANLIGAEWPCKVKMRDRGHKSKQIQLSSTIRKNALDRGANTHPQVPQFTLRPNHTHWAWILIETRQIKVQASFWDKDSYGYWSEGSRALGVLEELTVSPLCPGCPGSPSFPGGPCWAKNISLILLSFQPAEKLTVSWVFPRACFA